MKFFMCLSNFEGAGETEEGMTTMEGFLQFNFNIIKMATDEFSDENKLGEGGFVMNSFFHFH